MDEIDSPAADPALLSAIAEAAAPVVGAPLQAPGRTDGPAGDGTSDTVLDEAWSCGPLDAACEGTSELSNVGSTLSYSVEVGEEETRDMAIVATPTAGHAIMCALTACTIL